MVRIDEPEQIQPVLKIISVICGVLSHEPLQASMDSVYRFHRVVIVRKVMRRLCRVYLFGQPEGLDQNLMAVLPVMDKHGAVFYVAFESIENSCP